MYSYQKTNMLLSVRYYS